MTANPAGALTWQLWSRQRWVALAIALYTAGLAVAAHWPEAVQWRATVFMSSIPLVFGLLFFVAMFAYPEGDLLGRESTFPAEQFLLPVRTAQLVFWPMSYAAATAAAAWIGLGAWMLRPLDVGCPLVWPAAMLAAAVGWLQVLLWTPLGVPYLRAVLALTLIPGLILAGVMGNAFGLSSSLLTTLYLVTFLLAYPAAIAGVSLARRGDAAEWPWLTGRFDHPAPATERSSRLEPRVRPTPARSQLWFEWRSGGRTLPLATAVVFALLSLPLLWVRELTPLEANPPRSAFGGIEVNLWLALQAGSWLWPPLLAAIIGFGRRSYVTAPRDYSLHPFLATRPLTELGFAMARLQAAALSTLAAWAIALTFTGGWLLLPAREDERVAPLAWLLARHCPPDTLVTLLLLGLFLGFWTWKNLVQGMYADLSGRSLLVHGAPLLIHSLAIIGMLAFIEGTTGQPEVDPQYRTLPEAWFTLLLAAVAVKVLLMVVSSAALYRQRLLPGGRLCALILGWLVLAAASYGALHWIVHTGAASSALAGQATQTYLLICGRAVPAELHSPFFLASAVFLFLPLNRIAALPLALRANRTR